VFGAFLIFNFNYFQSKQALAVSKADLLRGSGGRLKTAPIKQQWISDHARPFNENGVASGTRHLIVVAGHSVTVSGHLHDADHDEQDWFLLEYQKHRGMPQAIVGHIRAGIAEAANDASSLLVFSGGETRASTGPDTEGASYFRVADAMDLWPSDSDLRARTVTEEFARDSFENLYVSNNMETTRKRYQKQYSFMSPSSHLVLSFVSA
jgi:hypothetical protein